MSVLSPSPQHTFLLPLSAANLPPVITSSVTGVLTISPSSPLTFTISVTDDNDNTSITPMVVSPPDYSLSQQQQPGSFIFQWQLPELMEEQEVSEKNLNLPLLLPSPSPLSLKVSDIVIVATDSHRAATVFSPQVEICACQNEGNCTAEGATVSSDLLLILNCICSPGLWIT